MDAQAGTMSGTTAELPRGAEVPLRPAGPRIYNLFPLLVGTVSAWRAELPRIAALGFDWVYLNPFHQAGGSGSLYAVADASRLDARLRDPDGPSDDEQLRGFCEAARAAGLSVMADLVVNHAANDGFLAKERPDLFVQDADGRPASPFAVDPVDPSIRTVWGDLAEFDYHEPRARDELAALFDGYVARMQGLGFKGFRCDAAYKVPATVWGRLIGAAKARDPDSLFAAETLGCTFEEARATAGAGFDYLFNSFAWWDLVEPWALENYERLRILAPSIAFPENHDMPRLAGSFDDAEPAEVAARLKCRYALAAFFSAGVLMPVGYEWGFRRALHVVETTPAMRETETDIDISDWVTAINRLRATLPAANVEGAQWRLSAPDTRHVALLRFDAGHPASAEDAVLVLVNPTHAPAAFDPETILSRTGGLLGAFVDRTPEAEPLALVAGESVTLGPYEVRILAARRAEAPRPGASLDPEGEGRVVIEAVSPEIDSGRTAPKRVVGESLAVAADIFTDGHDVIAAEVLYRVVGERAWSRRPMRFVDNDRWGGSFPLERNARHQFTIEAWRDPVASWTYEVTKKREAGVDVRLETIEGLRLARKAAELASGAEADALAALVAALDALPEGSAEVLDRLLAEGALIQANGERVNLSRFFQVLPVVADRLAARFSAWYEIFPRSQSGDPRRHGTFADVVARLPAIQALGFDVLYFPPIHPIGRTNRKGKNNTLQAEPGDVGSVYAIGGAEGGHEAVHPELGTLDDFRRLVAAAHDHGLEIALDFAINCSPDHPWIKAHPEWFEWRPDGTIRYAENPPKKYEDIVNVQFYGAALPSLWIELRDVLLGWARLGVRIFRVDNPHTKPIPFWEWCIREVNDRYPDTLFLAEAFTRPKMMKKLAKIGFQQSYTYFTWRDTKAELTAYMTELAGPMGEYYRPNFFANTPDINPVYLQTSGRAGFVVRATLAATLSSVYGIYSGFELCEATPIKGKEEYLDSEKYEIKAWDQDRPGNIRDHIIKLNHIRRENPALWDFRNVVFTNAWNDQIIGYARMTPERDNLVFVLVNLDPRNRQECTYEVPLWLLGIPDDGAVEVEDLLQGYTFQLRGKSHRIALDPAERSAIVWRLKPSP